MIIDPKTAKYLLRVTEALRDGKIENPKIRTCPECDVPYHADEYFDADRDGHVIFVPGFGDPIEATRGRDFTLLIGCQGYWLIDPSLVGLPKGNWS